MADRNSFAMRGGSPGGLPTTNAAPAGYVLNPGPRGGNGPFGAVPGNLGLPNPAGDLAHQFPHLNDVNASLSNDIHAGLMGQLSPGTLHDLQDFNAEYGQASGMPGSGFNISRLGRNIGLSAEQLKNTAINQYNQTIPTISHTQTVTPELQTQIAQQNALNAAAPDPTAAASHAESLYSSYLNGLRGPAGGTGGGVRNQGAPLGNFMTPTGAGGPPEQLGLSTGTGTYRGGQQFYGPAGGTIPGGAGGGAGDPWLSQFYDAWDQSVPVTSGSDYAMFGDSSPEGGY